MLLFRVSQQEKVMTYYEHGNMYNCASVITSASERLRVLYDAKLQANDA